MPLYGFVCEDCEQEFEELLMSSAQVDEVACPSCESGNVQRQLSMVAALRSSGSAGVSVSSRACAPGG